MVTAMTYTGKVQENGTVLLPKDAQEKLGLKPGDDVEISLNHSDMEARFIAHDHDEEVNKTGSTLSEYEATVALFRQWEEEAAQMTPEQQAEEDLATTDLLDNLQKSRLTLPIPNLSDHD